MKLFAIISWSAWVLSIVLALVFASLHKKDLTFIANVSMWIFLICANVSTTLLRYKQFKRLQNKYDIK